MPIRDADMYAKPSETSVAIGTNRGASGIDGLVATAVGFAIWPQAAPYLAHWRCLPIA